MKPPDSSSGVNRTVYCKIESFKVKIPNSFDNYNDKHIPRLMQASDPSLIRTTR